MVRVLITKIEKLTHEEQNAILCSLSKGACLHINNKSNEHARLSSITALSLLSDDERADLAYSDGGRPYFENLDADISISHSQSYACVAISDSKESPVGIDIEENEISGERFARVAERFFTEGEKKLLKESSPLEIWTKKEALLKHLKNDDLSLLDVDITNAQNVEFFTLSHECATLSLCTRKGENIILE